MVASKRLSAGSACSACTRHSFEIVAVRSMSFALRIPSARSSDYISPRDGGGGCRIPDEAHAAARRPAK